MPLIRTKLLPSTQTKGARIKAYYQKQSITIDYSYTVKNELVSNHRRAVLAMLDKLGLNWFDMHVETNRLNNLEFVHTWNNEQSEFLNPQAIVPKKLWYMVALTYDGENYYTMSVTTDIQQSNIGSRDDFIKWLTPDKVYYTVDSKRNNT